jgi:hypothetical protein
MTSIYHRQEALSIALREVGKRFQFHKLSIKESGILFQIGVSDI